MSIDAASNHNVVVGLYLCVAVYDHGFTISNESTQSNVSWKFEIFDGLMSYRRVFFDDEFCYFGIGHSQTFDIGRVFVEQQLENAAGCK